jgi:urease accessory protein
MRLVLVLAAALAAAPAAAHPGHEVGFAAGCVHPFGGLDHLLAMVAVGIWAGLIGGARRWIWPASFVAAMAVGALLGHAAVELPAMERLIALSVVLLGAAVALRWPAAPVLGAVVIFAAGLAHGFAHGAEAPLEGFGATMAGFLLGTALLHAAGLALGMARLPAAPVRALGAIVAAAGVALAAGLA